MARLSDFKDLRFKKLLTPEEHPVYAYNGFNPSTTVLPKGHTKEPGRRPLPVDLIYERDSAVPLRDGLKLYTDVFRLTTEGLKVPAIIGWSPYGKTGTGPQNYDRMAPFRAGIAKEATTGYEKFEACDPAEWCPRGYAIINPDARGAGKSEGNIVAWGIEEAEDIYDLIEWIIKQPWSDGTVTMAGNSWLAICQVNHASRCPHPALKCIAPWEAFTNVYEHNVCRGGVPFLKGFGKMISGGFAGHGSAEDMFSMVEARPLFDEYWEAKQVPVENITLPIYGLASYSTIIHTKGSFQTFRTARSTQKWLRVHPYQEWYDLYLPHVIDDLQKYFDYYVKGIKNDWPSTPPVRLSLLGFGTVPDIVERPEKEYPLARQKSVKYYLDAQTGKGSLEEAKKEGEVSYEAHHLTDCVDFVVKFDKYTELAGYPKLKLWASCNESETIDVVVQLRKVDKDGKPLVHLNYPVPVPEQDVPNLNTAKCLGPQGVHRFAHNCTYDASRSTEHEPFYTHRESTPIPAGTIASAEIGIWPIGMVFGPGEGLLIRISGHDMAFPEVQIAALKEPEDDNEGRHVVHTGGKYDTHILLPVIS
ncbi:alpha/beta-hydrolase, partial [Meredithblackwellia eburnea MCA 4105]